MGKKEQNKDYKELFPPGEIPTIRFKVNDTEQQASPSNLLHVPPKSVNVHLLRYALCKTGESHEGRSLEADKVQQPETMNPKITSYKSYIRNIGDKKVDFHPQNAPEVPGYRYYGAPVREGWLYVYNETTSNWHEYKIFPGGELQMVVWERFTEGYDEREPQKGESSVTYLKVKPDHVIWLAYSEVQWASKYTMKVVGNADLRKKRMQRIDCGSWLSELKGEDLLSTAQVRAEFVEYNGNRNISYGVYARDYQMCKALDNNDHHLYAYLHDPMGAMDDISEDLAYLYAEFDALVASLGTDKSKEEILNEILKSLGADVSSEKTAES